MGMGMVRREKIRNQAPSNTLSSNSADSFFFSLSLTILFFIIPGWYWGGVGVGYEVWVWGVGV